MTSKFYGIGVGPGDPELLTVKAVKALKECDVIFDVVGPNSKKSVSGSVVDSLGLGCRKERLTFSMDRDPAVRQDAIRRNAERIVEDLDRERVCAFITIGDPLLYSTYIYVMRHVKALRPGVEIVTIPGVTSFQMAASLAGLPLCEDTESLCVIPAFDEDEIDNYPIENADNIVFLKTYHTRDRILEILDRKKISYTGIYAVRLGIDGQFITSDLASVKDMPEEYLSLLIIKKK